MHVPYRKMHGTGNLILIVDQRGENLPPPSVEKLRELGNEATGPGFDQLMWISSSADKSGIVRYRVFNADGSEVEQCGNGVRCVAKYLAEPEGSAREFTLQSPAGLIEAKIHTDGQVSVSMGTPEFEPPRIPFVADFVADTYVLNVGLEEYEISAVSMGNPHAVIHVADVNKAPVAEVGPLVEHHERFPELTNVGFMRVIDSANIDLRVFERGVGETAACGTGACAAVVSGQRRGMLDEDVSVRLPGGKVMVSWRGGESPVWLKGDAEMINEGMLDL